MRRTVVFAAISLSVTVATLAGAPASAAGQAFVVGPDTAAARLNASAELESDVLKALRDTAGKTRLEISSHANANGAVMYLKDETRAAKALAAVRSYFADHSDVVVTVAPAEEDRIGFPPQYAGSVSLDDRMRDEHNLELFVRDARDEPEGFAIHRNLDGITVHVTDPSRGTGVEAAVRQVAVGVGAQVVGGPRDTWRVILPSEARGDSDQSSFWRSAFGLKFNPTQRLLLPRGMELQLLDRLREPDDLETSVRPDGLEVLIPTPAVYASFVGRLRQAFSHDADFTYATSPAWSSKSPRRHRLKRGPLQAVLRTPVCDWSPCPSSYEMLGPRPNLLLIRNRRKSNRQSRRTGLSCG